LPYAIRIFKIKEDEIGEVWKGAPVPIVEEAGWVPRPVWTGMEKVKIPCVHQTLNPRPFSL